MDYHAKYWYFTFGVNDQEHRNHYVKIYETFKNARKIMVSKFSDMWSMQYNELEFSSNEWLNNLTEYKFPVFEFFMINDLPCVAMVNSSSKTWCGYCGISKDSPLFEKHYDDAYIDCHGGLTYCGYRMLDIPGYDDYEYKNYWFFGFDCSHYDDYIPAYDEYSFCIDRHEKKFRNLDFIKEELESMTKQIKELEKISAK